MILLALAAAATAPAVETRKGFPHRDWGDEVILAAPIEQAQACFVESLMVAGRVTPVAVEGGADVYFAIASFTPGAPYIRFMLRQQDSQTRVTALYRHPISRKTVSGFVADIQASCEAVVSNHGLGSGE